MKHRMDYLLLAFAIAIVSGCNADRTPADDTTTPPPQAGEPATPPAGTNATADRYAAQPDPAERQHERPCPLPRQLGNGCRSLHDRGPRISTHHRRQQHPVP